MKLKKEIESTLLKYVKTKTHTSTKLENNNINFFKDWFKSVDYFKTNPDKYGFYAIENDYLARKIPWGLLKGEGEDTIILIHHSDTVDTDDYGKYKDTAYSPEELESKYREESSLDEDTKSDLGSGKWIFARGVADMKGGGAIHLSLFKKYSLEKNFQGNLLLLALPDEENLSAGMRAAIALLNNLRDKFNLNYILMLNGEPHEREDENNPTIYDGSIGKIMPVVYVRGKLAHVGQVFRGVNPISILSEIVRRTELREDFIEKVGNTVTPPPTWLYMKDNKDVYDVSLPISAMGYMSILTLKRRPKEIFKDLKNISQEAFMDVIDRINKAYGEYNRLQEVKGEDLKLKANVLFYSELYKKALEDSGDKFKEEIKNLNMEIKEKFDQNQINMVKGVNLIIEKTLEFVKDRSPVVIIALCPPYYPHVHNRDLEDTKNIDQGIKSIIGYSKENWNQEYRVQNYYTGITDLSYAMTAMDRDDIDYIEENMLMWGDLYSIDFNSMKKISTPVLNIGPWGKDFHKYTERVYREDLFERTPILIDKLIKEVLGN